MSKVAIAWVTALIVLLLVLSFFVGRATEAGGHYTLDVYSGGIHYVFPLAATDNQPDTSNCVNNRVILSLSSKSDVSTNNAIAGLGFCGSAYFDSKTIVQQK